MVFVERIDIHDPLAFNDQAKLPELLQEVHEDGPGPHRHREQRQPPRGEPQGQGRKKRIHLRLEVQQVGPNHHLEGHVSLELGRCAQRPPSALRPVGPVPRWTPSRASRQITLPEVPPDQATVVALTPAGRAPRSTCVAWDVGKQNLEAGPAAICEHGLPGPELHRQKAAEASASAKLQHARAHDAMLELHERPRQDQRAPPDLRADGGRVFVGKRHRQQRDDMAIEVVYRGLEDHSG
mmetsp:Transcript_96666/g.288668  ORF Transcript_96666/g.288668 Transcript_96666/m.288668 type:complete len:238 (-) Transcript_96666:13-726(-)